MCRSTSPAQFLQQQAAELRREYPKLAVLPVAADFTKPFDLPDAAQTMPRVGFFPGSTIGNFEPHEAAAFLRHAGRILGRGATFIVGVDLVKDTQVLQKAYNDSQGVTAKFNLNLLTRINRELGAKFNLGLLRASRLLQPRALAHRDASGEPQAPAHQGVRRVHRLPRRRNHPHREQLQVFGRVVRRAGARRRLDADRRCGPTPTTTSASTCSTLRRASASSAISLHSQRAASPGDALLLPEARRLAARIIVTSIASTSGCSAASSAASLARCGETSSTAS